MERCPTCGAALTPGVAWCGQCFAHRSVATAAVSPVRASGGPIGGFGTAPSRAVTVAAPAAEPLVRLTRWEKTPTTFGPAGRLVATLLLLLPLGVMVVGGLADPFVWGGAGLYLAVVVPWALRDIWKAGTIRVG